MGLNQAKSKSNQEDIKIFQNLNTHDVNNHENSCPRTFGDMCKFLEAKTPHQCLNKCNESNPVARNPSSTYKQARRLKDPNKLLDIQKIKKIMKSYIALEYPKSFW